MTFNPTDPPATASALGIRLEVEEDPETPGTNVYRGAYRFALYDAGGNRVSVRSGQILPELTDQERAGIQSLLDRLYARVLALLPPPESP